MAVAVECPSCGRRFRAKDRHRGRQTNCPGCGRSLAVRGERVPDHDVFVSYSSKDKPVADAVCAALEAKRLRCWIAPRDILPGVEWGSAIVDAIQEAPVFVLVFTAHANQSQQVLREVERAVSKGAAIIPMRLENVPPTKTMEYFISASHWLDAMSGPLEAHIDQLARTVAELLKQREQRAEPPAPANSNPAAPVTVPATAPPPAVWNAPPAPPVRTGTRGRWKWGVAVALVAFAAAGVAWSLRGKRGTDAPDARPPNAAIAAAASSALPAPADGPRTIDLLPLVDLGRDRVSGVWAPGESGLGVLSRGKGNAALALPYAPPEEYDVRCEFTGPAGDGAVVLVCPNGGQSFAWIVKQRRGGFSSLRGRPFSKASFPLAQGANMRGRTVSLVQVRKGAVRAYVNGTLIAEAAPSELRMVRGGRHWNLGIAADSTPATFHAIQVVEVSGRGNVLRGGPTTGASDPEDFSADGAGNQGNSLSVARGGRESRPDDGQTLPLRRTHQRA